MRTHYVLFLLCLPAAMAGQQAAPACSADPNYQVLDFWLGEWEVRTAEGILQGNNRIEKVLNGCAVMEHWTDIAGGEGKSWFYYNNLNGEWNQIWMTADATALGGTKEKRLIAVLDNGGTRFQGTLPLPDGGILLDRTTLIPQEDGRVRQTIEISQDGGTTWSTTFDAWYSPSRN